MSVVTSGLAWPGEETRSRSCGLRFLEGQGLFLQLHSSMSPTANVTHKGTFLKSPTKSEGVSAFLNADQIFLA